jgi:hypothetical protein
LATYAEFLAFGAAHEIGHQFNLSKQPFAENWSYHDTSGTSLMSVPGLGGGELKERFLNIVFDASAIRRRVRSPGRGTDADFFQPTPSE